MSQRIRRHAAELGEHRIAFQPSDRRPQGYARGWA